MPFPRKHRDGIALGGQQAQRLQQLRLVSENHIHEQHLHPFQAVKSPHSTRQADALSPEFGHSARASRTVEAIIESRAIDREGDDAPSKAMRLRETIRGVRGGFHTERSDETRPRTTLPPAASVHSARPASHAADFKKTRVTQGFHQRIAAVRRRRVGDVDAGQRRQLSREELEWIEKQLQFTQRVGLLEKECSAWWQSFYASAASSGGSLAPEASEGTRATTLSIQKQVEEAEQLRRQDSQELQQQLSTLRRQADRVTDMVCRMRDGEDFIADLQDAMDSFERDLGQFRIAQREIFDKYVLEEKLLERDLTAFFEKAESWEQQELERKKVPKSASRSKKSAPFVRRTASGMDEKPAHVAEKDSDQPHEVPSRSEIDLVKRVRTLNHQILESGGLKGGWDDREHAVFSSVLLKCGLTDEMLLANHVSNVEANQEGESDTITVSNSVEYETLVARAIRKCVQGVVTKTENAVRNHFDWYLGHLRLIQEKKDAIAQWKQRKETDRQQLIRQGLQQVDTTLAAETTESDFVSHPLGAVVQGDNEAKKAKRNEALEAKERVRKARELDKWREEKERRANEEQEMEREQRAKREAREAKKRQELLEKKQQLFLYKLQKEEDSAMLQRNRSTGNGGGGSPPGSQSPGVSNEELVERSRRAIEQAKAKRAQLQALEEARKKQQELPERPRSVNKRANPGSGSGSAASPTDSEGSPSSRDTTLLRPTKAFEARHLSKVELKRKEKERATQGAHDAYFPGAGMISDVKIKSFGHIAIAPRAVPSWRRNM